MEQVARDAHGFATDAHGRDALNARLGALHHCIQRAIDLAEHPEAARGYLETAEAHRRAIAAMVNR